MNYEFKFTLLNSQFSILNSPFSLWRGRRGPTAFLLVLEESSFLFWVGTRRKRLPHVSSGPADLTRLYCDDLTSESLIAQGPSP